MPQDDERHVAYMGGEPPERSRLYYFTPDEVAAHLRVTRRTVYRWLTEGKLKARRAGRGWRISERDIAEMLNADGYCFSPELAASDVEEKTGRKPDCEELPQG